MIKRRLFSFVGFFVATALFVVGVSVMNDARAEDQQAPISDQQEQADALAQAMASGERVEVPSLTDEYSQTFANPDGATYQLEMTVVPTRVEQADGSWVPVDSTLQRTSDGRVVPRASAVGLSLSGGGSGVAAISLDRHGSHISLSWPGTLPTPILAGPTATYVGVIPGVDLLLTATDEGYRQVLRVNTPDAAQNAALDKLRFGVDSSDLRILPNREGGFDVVDGLGTKVFVSPAPIMWDSSGDEPSAGPGLTPTPTPAQSSSTEQAETPEAQYEAPSAGDVIKDMPVQANDNSVTVTPNQHLLDDADTVYPVYVDPTVALSLAERTMVGSNGEHDYGFSGDEGVGRCDSVCPRTLPAPYIKRMFFEFTNAKLLGKKVLNATFRAYEMWSYSCSASWVRLSRSSANISSATRWPGPSAVDQLGDRSVSAGRSTACSPAQPDKWIEFNDNPAEADENLTPTVANFAAGKYGTHMTLALWASDEGSAQSWKRFRNDAALSVQYMWNPGVTDGVGVLTTTDPGSRKCATSETAPTIVANPRPEMTATIHTANKPTSADDPGSLKALFRLDHKKTDGTWEIVWPTAGSTVSGKAAPDVYKPNGYIAKTSSTTNFAENGLYRMVARTWSHGVITETGKAVDLYGPWNGSTTWCYFLVDTTGALAPTVTSTDLSPCLADDCHDNLQPGALGHFTFSTNETNVERFQWKVDGVLQAATPLVTTPTTSGLTQSVTVKLPAAGEHVVEAAAVEAVTHKISAKWTPYRFKVGPPPAEIGTWHVGESPGAIAAADLSGSLMAHPMSLSGGAAVDANGRRENATDSAGVAVNDSSLAFPGNANAIAATSAAVVDTTQSFTVSAWAFLRNSGANATVVAQAGTDARSAGFALRWNASSNKWEFVWHRIDSGASTPTYQVVSAATTGQPTGVWTHLTGVYDAGAGELRLYVNGRPQSTMTGVVTEVAPGPLVVGASRYTSAGLSEPFNGLVDEIHVAQRTLGDDEVRTSSSELLDESGDAALALVGLWDAAAAADGATSLQDQSPYLRMPMSLVNGAVVSSDPSDSFVTFDGSNDYGSTSGPVLDESASFTVSAKVSLDQAKVDALPVNSQVRVLGQQLGNGSSWAIWYEKTASAAGLWKFGRWNSDGTQDAAAADYLPADVGLPVHVTGVYDAASGGLRIYIENEDRDLELLDFFSQGTGELSAGRGMRTHVSDTTSTWGDYLGGHLYGARAWVGAMSQNQVLNLVASE